MIYKNKIRKWKRYYKQIKTKGMLLDVEIRRRGK